MEPATQVDITVVIPCLDEEEAVGSVVQRAWEGIERSGLTGEVVVVDNGSTDRSAAIAERQGARVVSEPERGYGNAYLAGLATARGRYIVMGDADETYDFGTIPEFVRELETAPTWCSERGSRAASTQPRCRGRTGGSATRSSPG